MGTKNKIHLKDIAEKAGVSTALVSYVLNDRLTDRINPATAKRIKRIAKELNYHPDYLAKALKSQRTNTIGLVLADLANPFSAQVARLVEDEVRRFNNIAIIGSADERKETFEELTNSFIARQVDGLILLPAPQSEKEILRLHQQGIPFVLMDRYYKDTPYPFVINDNHYSTYSAVKELVKKGKKRIGLVTLDIELNHIEDRKQGYIKACQEEGLEMPRVMEVNGSQLHTEVEEALNTLFAESPTLDALLFTTDLVALYGLKYAIKYGLDVPNKVEIMAVDEASYYDIFPNEISYYRQPLEKMVRIAVDFLMKRIGDPDLEPISEVVRGEIRNTSFLDN